MPCYGMPRQQSRMAELNWASQSGKESGLHGLLPRSPSPGGFAITGETMFPPCAPFFLVSSGRGVGGLPPGEARLRRRMLATHDVDTKSAR
jgi:hypothetical protein